MEDRVTVVTVTFKTPAMTYVAVNSFRRYYRDLPYILVDNGGSEQSVKLWRKMAKKGFVTLIENQQNQGHGPALNQGLALVDTPYAFLLDSDTRTKQGGFLEKMLRLFKKDGRLFAVGWLREVNRQSGVPVRSDFVCPDPLPYVHPHACLLDVGKFRRARPFSNQGSPAWAMMRDVKNRGWTLADFPVSDYIWHKEAGTRGLFGGRLRAGTDEEPGQWKRLRI